MEATYSDRLAAVELYLTRAEARLNAESPGSRLVRQIWLLTEELASIGESAGCQVAKLDASGEPLGDMEDVVSTVARLQQRRRLLLIRVADRFGLDARLLIAGDSIEMERLQHCLDKRVPPAAEPDDDVQWSKPEPPRNWANMFNCCERTFLRRVENGTIRAKKLSSKAYQVDKRQIPKTRN